MAPGHISWKLSVILDNGRWIDEVLGWTGRPSWPPPPGAPSSGPWQLLPMSLCQLAAGFYAQRERRMKNLGESGSVISSPPCAVNSVQEGVSGEPDVASGDHLVSVLKGWGLPRELDPWDSDKAWQTTMLKCSLIIS